MADDLEADVGDETDARRPLALAEKFNSDLRGRFFGSPLYRFDSIGQSIRVDIYAYATTRTDHLLVHF